MIKDLHLTNFQGHKDSHLEFAPGVNVITGESDKGKSSIMRALVWLATNRPSGAGEKWAWWGMEKNDVVSVEVRMNEGVLVRFRKGSKNGYRVITEPNAVTDLMAIRTDVPTEVSDLLNLSEHNIQAQHLGHFLLADTPGEVARKLNEVVGMDIIDACLKNANHLITENNRDITQHQHRVSELTSQLYELKDVDKLERLVLQVEELTTERDDLNDAKQRMENALVDLKEADDAIAELQEFVAVEPQVKAWFTLLVEKEELATKATHLRALHDSVEGLDIQIEQAAQVSAEAQNMFDNALIELGVCPMCMQKVQQ